MQTVLTNGTVFGTAPFFYSMATGSSVQSQRYDAIAHAGGHHQNPREWVGPPFEQEPAKISGFQRGVVELLDFSKIQLRYGNCLRSFLLHNNFVQVLIDAFNVSSARRLVGKPVTVIKKSDSPVGFSLDSDSQLHVPKSQWLASGATYLGTPRFFYQIAMEASYILENTLPVNVPLRPHKGKISEVHQYNNGNLRVKVDGDSFESSFRLSGSLYELMIKMFGGTNEGLKDKTVTLFSEHGKKWWLVGLEPGFRFL